MSTPIRAAIVGTGFMGPVHAEALRRLSIDIAGVLGSSPAKSEAARDSMGLGRAYTDFEEVLADETVTAVHLCVPNTLHYAMAKRALQAGKHVLCEKPLAMDTIETAELVELARQAKRAAGVCYNMRFYPLNLEARQRVAAGDVGSIYLVNGSYVQDWLLYDTDYNWRVLAESGGSLRAVADIGTHWMDMVSAITGLAVEAVFADLATIHPVRQRPTGEVQTFSGKLDESAGATEPVDIATDDYGCILFRYRGGARGSLHVSQVTAGRKNCCRYEISGSDCSLSWNSEQPEQLWIGRRDKANEILMRDPALMGDLACGHTAVPGGHAEGYPDTFRELFRAFYDYIAAGDMDAEPTFPTFQAGHTEVALCEAILTSSREQRWVEL